MADMPDDDAAATVIPKMDDDRAVEGAAGEEVPVATAMAAGGGARLSDGEVNLARFSIGPVEEFHLQWWNRRVGWEVRREPTNHQVVVAEVVRKVWRVHMAIAAAIVVLFTLVAVVAFGMPLVYALAMDAVLLLLGWGMLRYEQMLDGGDAFEVGDITVLDATLWEGIKAQAASLTEATIAAQKKRYAAAVVEAKREHKEAVAKAKEEGRIPGKFVAPDKDEYISDSDVAMTEAKIAAKVRGHLTEESLATLHAALLDKYFENPATAEALGRGVRGCECAACAVNAHLGVRPADSGVVVARRIREKKIAAGVIKLSRAEKAARDREVKRKLAAKKESEAYIAAQRVAREDAARKKIKAEAAARVLAARKTVRDDAASAGDEEETR